MALVLADRVLETSTSEGLGTFALAGAQTGYQTFSSGIGDGNTCYYTINGQTTEQWEVGIGTVGAGTLARTTLISSNTGSFINFVAGVKNVFVTQPASKSIYKDENGNAIPLGSASATQLDITAQGDLRLQDTTGGEYVAIQAPATLASSYTLTMPTDDGTAGQALVTDGSGVLSWSSAASGDVYGPASTTDNAVARFDLTTGKIIQNSAVTIDDTGNVAGVGTLSASGQLTLTNASDYNLYASGAGANFMQGKLGVGAVPLVTTGALHLGANLTGNATVFSQTIVGNVQPDVTSVAGGARSVLSTAASAFTLTNVRHFAVTNVTLGSGSAVTNQYGFFVPSITSATNNYAFYGDVASGTGCWNFYAAGTAANYFAGNVGIGTTTNSGKLDVTGGNVYNNTTATGSTGYYTNNGTRVNAFSSDFNANATYIDVNGNTYLRDVNASYVTRLAIQSGIISLGAAPGSESLRVTPVASAVNYLQIQGAATGGLLYVTSQGSDTNVGIAYQTKGTGFQYFVTGGTTQFIISAQASAVNYIGVQGGTTGNAAIVYANGSDTNVDLQLQGQGTGVLKFGTYTAGIIAQAGYITIKDAGGTTRRLLVG